jgi:D-glycero-D-manno-heptose 1,7-bisphosphate phosphatase
MKKAAFLDRDGVINRKRPEGEYVTRWDDLEILPGVGEAIAMLRHAGFEVVVISNQRCVAKGLLSMDGLWALHECLSHELAQAGAALTAAYYCPHDLQPPCTCRKPLPGMLLQAAAEHEIDLASSWMIGDSDIDIQAGQAAGCRTARISDSGQHVQSPADISADSLLPAVRQILNYVRGLDPVIR